MWKELRQIDSGCITDTAGKTYMGRKDTAGRDFFSDKERFAEMLNVHLYHGTGVVQSDDLVRDEHKYPSLTGAYGEKQRDILLEDIRRGLYYGMELETESDYSMPERVMVYDACEYEYQIRAIYRKHRELDDFADYREKKSRMKESDSLCPVLTIVLYLGEGHWEGRSRLSEMFQAFGRNTESSHSRVHDYDFLLIEADFVDSEDYRTDLKEFFRAMQCRQDRKKLRALLKSEDFMNLRPETEQAIAAHLNVERLVYKMKKEELPMCRAFEELMAEERQSGKEEGIKEGIKKGIKEGIIEGKQEEKFMTIKRMHRLGMKEDIICKAAGCTKKEFAVAMSR